MRIGSLDDLFQPFDPAPMHQRALSAEVDAYVLDRIDLSPPSDHIALRVLLPASESACCDAVQSAFRDHFARGAIRLQRALQKHFATGRRTLAGAVILALVLILLSQTVAGLSDIRIIQTIANGIAIVVWVTLWRPLEFLLYDWRGMDRQFKTYRRLAKADVRCVTET
ncbi:MAG: hypothetical protein ACTS3F_08850 [Phycisphaerales bacterium]